MPANNLAAQAAAVKARGPKRPGTAARPAASAPAKPGQQALPAFMQGSMRAAWASGAPQPPTGNVATVMAEAKMPQHATAELRAGSPYAMTSFGPIVGPRPPQAVAAFAGVDGIFDSILNVAKSVIPKGTVVGHLIGSTTEKGQGLLQQVGIKSPSGTPAQVAVQPQPTGFYQSMAPQNDTQKWMLVGAGVLGLGLIALLVRRR